MQPVESAIPARDAVRAPARLVFLDNVKVGLTVLVIAHHAGQAYGPTGGAWPIFNPERARILGPFFHTNASYFMGLFFLISAYFVPSAYDRKGAAAFLKDKFRRLGIPLAIWIFLVAPVLIFLRTAPHGVGFPAWYLDCFAHGKLEFAHLWFVSHLLAYALLYALWRRFRPTASVHDRPFPSNRAIALYAIALALVSMVVRWRYPIDRWVFIGVPSELAHLPQYLSLFVIGLIAAREGWLAYIPARSGRFWGAIGLALLVFRFCRTIFQWRWIPAEGLASDLFWPTWEAFLCVGMCVAWLYWFSRHGNWTGRLPRNLSRNAYTMYLAHLPIVVLIQKAFAGTHWPPLVLFFVVTVLAVTVTWAVSEFLLRRIPGARRVL